MKKITLFITLFLLAQLSFAQQAAPFEVALHGSSEKHILLIPGFSCSGDVWESTVEQLKDSYTCHVFTMAGFAGIPTNGTADWNLWRKEIANYISAKQLGQTTVLGHSLGGMMALDLAASFPSLIKEILVVDALPCLAALNNAAFESQSDLDCTASINMMVNQSPEQFEMMQKSSIGYMSTNTDKHDEIVSWTLKSDRATLGKIFCELSNLDLRNELDQIKCPTRVLLEAPFQALEPVIAKQYGKLNEVQLNFAPKGLHFVMYDAPKWYASQVLDFLLK